VDASRAAQTGARNWLRGETPNAAFFDPRARVVASKLVLPAHHCFDRAKIDKIGSWGHSDQSAKKNWWLFLSDSLFVVVKRVT
jgi:hypothetical protein